MPDKALSTIQFSDPDQVGWRGQDANRNKLGMGHRVRPETVPSAITIRSDTYPLPDVLAHFVVSSKFRDLVERFEPGIHQFIPVDVYLPSRTDPIETYYWFNVGQRLDSVDREHTTYRWDLDWTKENGFWSKRGVSDAKLVLSTARIGAHHIWVDPHVLTFNSGLCSNSFGEAAIAAKLSGLSVTPREEV